LDFFFLSVDNMAVAWELFTMASTIDVPSSFSTLCINGLSPRENYTIFFLVFLDCFFLSVDNMAVAWELFTMASTIDVPSSFSTLCINGLSPRANYTDRAKAACQRSDCQL
jgi:hypothetical protein